MIRKRVGLVVLVAGIAALAAGCGGSAKVSDNGTTATAGGTVSSGSCGTISIGMQAPITGPDTAATARGKAVTINVLANDSDPNGDALTITAVSRPQFGAATTNGQNVTYTPNPTFAGQDSFSYFVSDGHGNTTAGSVTVVVGGQLSGHLIYLPVVRR